MAGIRYSRHRFSPQLRSQLRELNDLDNWHGPGSCAVHLSAVVAASVLPVAYGWWWYPVSLLVVGSRQRALLSLLHWSVHGTAARSRWLNLLIGTVIGAYPIMQTHYGYKLSHVATHHPLLGDPVRDPDTAEFVDRGVYEVRTRRDTILRLLILPAFGGPLLRQWLRSAVRLLRRKSAAAQSIPQSWQAAAKRDRVAFGCFWLVVLVVAVLTGTVWDVAVLWFVPYLTVYQMIGWYVGLSEHTPIARDNHIDLYMTRNKLSHGLELLLTGPVADNMHLEHHLDARTPYWNLGRAMRIRLADPEYARVVGEFGGLFRNGPANQPSALAAVMTGLIQRAEAKRSP
ncbi:MAG: hypothetical protein JWN03_8412 [Nocardia sp.]|uniref:fatty acid desaturase n=1 Tax=Nocardia sp. TaxID=1821 RepID=UPI0026381796|nr:fatty acid desaturase [Nocardia sp.]MCU1648137.1 hypothetical protein [Nocardia sp.]